MRTRLGVGLCVCVVLGLSGTTIGVADASDDELVTTKVERAGISIDVPRTWSGRDFDPKQLLGRLHKLKRTDPELADLLQEVIASGAFDHSRLIAIEPSTSDTLNVMTFNMTGTSLDDIKADASSDPQMQAAGYSSPEVTDTRVGKYPAVRINRVLMANTSDLAAAGVLQTELDVAMPKHRAVSVIVVVDNMPEQQALVERIIASIRPL